MPGDFTNYDVFLHDLQTGTTELVSHAFGGGFANGDSYYPTISDDGQRIGFRSDASNLLPPGTDTNSRADFFVFDRGSGTTERVSLRSDETPVALSNSSLRR